MAIKFAKAYPGDWYPGKAPNPGAEVVSPEALNGERGSNMPMDGSKSGESPSVEGYPNMKTVSREAFLNERGSSAPMSGNQSKTY